MRDLNSSTPEEEVLSRGKTLWDVLLEEDLVDYELVTVLHYASLSLQDFHRSGMIQIDLNPENLVVELEGGKISHVQIIQSELATRAGDYVQVKVEPFSTIAPENVRGAWAAPEGDVYSLGMIIAFVSSFLTSRPSNTLEALITSTTLSNPMVRPPVVTVIRKLNKVLQEVKTRSVIPQLSSDHRESNRKPSWLLNKMQELKCKQKQLKEWEQDLERKEKFHANKEAIGPLLQAQVRPPVPPPMPKTPPQRRLHNTKRRLLIPEADPSHLSRIDIQTHANDLVDRGVVQGFDKVNKEIEAFFNTDRYATWNRNMSEQIK
ncbi:hypothetical protein SK128_014315, partial [Halocaridina rubra]